MQKWNRREFTRNAGMLTLFSPFVSLFDPSVASAQSADAGPAKYLLILTANGTDPDLWDTQRGADSMTGPLGGSAAGDITLLSEFDSLGTAGSHGAFGGLMGSGFVQGGTSLDFYVANDLRNRGIITQVPNVHLGGVGQPGLAFDHGRGGLQTPQLSLTEAFSSIFDGSVAPPPPAPGEPVPVGPSEAEIRLLRRQSILDRVVGDIAQLRSSLGSLEREKLDIHIDSIEQLELRIRGQLANTVGAEPVDEGPALNFVQPASCDQPGSLATDLQPVENSAVHLDLAITAMSCDLTRVAHVEFGHHQSCNVDLPGSQGDWHSDFMHASNDRSRLIVLERWLADRYVEAIQKLKATPAPDGNGSLYDQTFFLWVREMGNAVVHLGNNMPFVVAGGAGGYLRRGGNYVNGNGDFHLRVLMSAAEAMGVTDTSGFGGAGRGASDRQPVDALRA